ncbi:hypothetical protein GF345_02955 [Candidatus Woesearchaeota archaeon]|nr:hypothetical protein [Candidatus Woesearchaeota archaeon]
MANPIDDLASVWYDIKKYYGFDKDELKGIVVAVLVLAFIVSFDDWGVEKFEFFYGLKNLFNSMLIVLLSFLVYLSAQRITAIKSGFKAEWRVWTYGLLIGLVLVFVSRGKLWFLAPGGVIVYHMAGHRICGFRYGLNYWPLGMSAIMGPLACAVLAIIFNLLLGVFPENSLLEKAMRVNIWLAIINMLPIPPLDGSNLFFATRMVYVFLLGLVLGTLIPLLFSIHILYSLLIGLIAGFILWQVLFWTLER